MPCVWCLVPGSYQTTRRQRPLTSPIHDRSIAENSINLILSRHLIGGSADGTSTGAQSTDSFNLVGAVKKVDGTPVGQGFTVKAVNNRNQVNFIPTNGAPTRADGTYNLSWGDFFGPTVDVGDEIRITVEDSSNQVVGSQTYIVTQAAVDNFGATGIDVIPILVPFELILW